MPGEMEPKKYIVVSNHVREIVEPKQDSKPMIDLNNEEQSRNTNKLVKKSKKGKKSENKQSESDDNNVEINDEVNGISENDLEELKAVYKKCKSVLLKIESKYGHLLNLDEFSSRKRKHDSIENHECRCSLNKKVVFNDDGQTESVGSSNEHHICPSRLQMFNKFYPVQNRIEIESENTPVSLPDSVLELEEILKNPSSSTTLRNKVIDKIKYIRHMNSNIMRFDKHELIQKLKTNPDDIIDFKGTNFSSIVGYPIEPT